MDAKFIPTVVYLFKEDFDDFCKGSDLFDADQNCEHEIIDAPGGGIKCTKCTGWFCL